MDTTYFSTTTTISSPLLPFAKIRVPASPPYRPDGARRTNTTSGRIHEKEAEEDEEEATRHDDFTPRERGLLERKLGNGKQEQALEKKRPKGSGERIEWMLGIGRRLDVGVVGPNILISSSL
ncbi:hypothetical protein Q9189_005784 [Teloschistes chrysophthalmus]